MNFSFLKLFLCGMKILCHPVVKGHSQYKAIKLSSPLFYDKNVLQYGPLFDLEKAIYRLTYN